MDDWKIRGFWLKSLFLVSLIWSAIWLLSIIFAVVLAVWEFVGGGY